MSPCAAAADSVKVGLIVADDQQMPDMARQTAERMVKRDKVDFMTGVVLSNLMLGTVFKNHADACASACKMPS